jgi:hypothetical protein
MQFASNSYHHYRHIPRSRMIQTLHQALLLEERDSVRGNVILEAVVVMVLVMMVVITIKLIVTITVIVMIIMMSNEPRNDNKKNQEQSIRLSVLPVDEEDSEVILCALACKNIMKKGRGREKKE